jgi:N-acetylmuramoyl-L-alanine amidase
MRALPGAIVGFVLLGLTSACPRPVAAADPRLVAVEMSADGESLGRLVGERRGQVAYFALDEVARLVGARFRPAANSDQATLAAPHGVVEVARDRAQIHVDGRPLTLSAPVRVARGRWQVPGDLLVRALPAVVGKGIRVVPSAVPLVLAPTAPPAKPTPARPTAASRTIARSSAPPASPPAPASADAAASVPRSEREGSTSAAPTGDPTPAPTALVLERPRPAPAPPVVPGVSGGVETPAASGGPTSAPLPALPLPPSAPSGPSATAPSVSVPSTPRPNGKDDQPEPLRYRSYPTYTRVVLEGETTAEPRLVETAGGLMVTLPGLSHRGPASTRAVRDGLVGGLELVGGRTGATLRVTFDRAPATRRVYRLDDPARLVLDFYRGAAGAPGAQSGGAPAGEGLRVIVLDPGHGGHDPGAIGPSGLQEKELTLDVARRVALLLQDDQGVRVVLTRTTDRFIPLRERTAFANRERADLFVSIHVNSAPSVTATGAETYFLSSEATDNAARQAAAAENRVVALESNAKGPSRDLLRSILWDLAQSDFQQESSRLAEVVQNTLDRALRLPSRGVKQAPFYVLGGAAMPAVLVEIGFITNSAEEQRLRDDGYRDRVARAIAAGLGEYKRSYDRRAGAVARQ